MDQISRRNPGKLAAFTGLLFGVLGMLIFITFPVHAQGITFSKSARNCDSNAVIYCGALTTSELQQKYLASSSAQIIYDSFGITKADIANLGHDAVAGTVTKSGDVYVNGQLVATHALTAGRQPIAGSTTVHRNNLTYYLRPTSVSFVSSPLDAFVVRNSTGQFEYAILASCGNPIHAQAVAPPATPQAPTAPQQKPLTTVPVQQQTVTVQVTTPPATPQATPPALPNTGPGPLLGIFAGTSALGTFGANRFLKRRARKLTPLDMLQ